MERKRGKVRWFNDERGFGFIESATIGRDVFIHFRDCDDPGLLKEGVEIEFDLSKNAKGFIARNAHPLDWSELAQRAAEAS